jgi:hypothetical protein
MISKGWIVLAPYRSERVEGNSIKSTFKIDPKSMEKSEIFACGNDRVVHGFLPEKRASDAFQRVSSLPSSGGEKTLSSIRLLGSEQTLNWLQFKVSTVKDTSSSSGWDEFRQLRNTSTLPKPTQFIYSNSLNGARGIVLDLGESQVPITEIPERFIDERNDGSWQILDNPVRREILRDFQGTHVTVNTEVVIPYENNVAVFAYGDVAVPTTASYVDGLAVATLIDEG